MRDKAGPLLALVIVLGYLGLEATAAHKAAPRMKASAIYTKVAAAHRAVERCGPLTPATLEQGVRNLVVMREQASRKLTEQQTDASPDAIARQLDEQSQQARAKTDALVDDKGCEHRDVRYQRSVFDIHARNSLR